MTKTYFKYLFFNIIKKLVFWVFVVLGWLLIFALLIIAPLSLHVNPWVFWSYSYISPLMFLLFIVGVCASILTVIIFKNNIDDGSELIIVSKPIIRRNLIFVKFLVYITVAAMASMLFSSCGWLTVCFRGVNAWQSFSCFSCVLITNIIFFLFFGAIAIIISSFLNKLWIILSNVILVMVFITYTITTTAVIGTPTNQSKGSGSASTSISTIDGNGNIKRLSFLYPLDIQDDDIDLTKTSLNFLNFNQEKSFWDDVQHKQSNALMRTFNVISQYSLMNNAMGLASPKVTKQNDTFGYSTNSYYNFDQPILPSLQNNEEDLPIICYPDFYNIPFFDEEYPKNPIALITKLLDKNDELSKKFMDFLYSYLLNCRMIMLGDAHTGLANNRLLTTYDNANDGLLIASGRTGGVRAHRVNYSNDEFKYVGNKHYDDTKGVGITDTQRHIFDAIYNTMFTKDGQLLTNEEFSDYYHIDLNFYGLKTDGTPRINSTNDPNTAQTYGRLVHLWHMNWTDMWEQAVWNSKMPSLCNLFKFTTTAIDKITDFYDLFHLCITAADLQSNDCLQNGSPLKNSGYIDAFGIHQNRYNAEIANICLMNAWIKFKYYLFNKLTIDLNTITATSRKACFNTPCELPGQDAISSSPIFPTIVDSTNHTYKNSDSLWWIYDFISTMFPAFGDDSSTKDDYGWQPNSSIQTYFNNASAICLKSWINFLLYSESTGWEWKNIGNDGVDPTDFTRVPSSYYVNLRYCGVPMFFFSNFAGTFNTSTITSPYALWGIWICISLIMLSFSYAIFVKLDIK